MNKNEIITRAKEFCIDNKINDYPVRIVQICKNYDISVFEQYLPSDVSGFIVVQEENFHNYNTNKLIVVNLSDSARRRRFTIAHELAHYILHREKNQPIYAHRDAGQYGGIETEANLFASNILMPEKLVKDALSLFENDEWGEIPFFEKIRFIADKFAVSEQAAEVRLDQLGVR